MSLEIGLFGKTGAEETRKEHRREAHPLGIEGLGGFIESHALQRDPVFRALELGLELPESLRRLELGIFLDDDHQPRQGGRQSVLGLLELGECLRIVQLGRIELGLSGFRPGFGNGRERVLFEGRRSLDRLDQIRDEVGPPLILLLNLGPLGFARLIELVETIVRAADGQRRR